MEETALTKTELEIINFTESAGRNLVTVKILNGEPQSGMKLKCVTSGSIWNIRGSAFLPIEKWEEGIRSLILESEEKNELLDIGDKLIS